MRVDTDALDLAPRDVQYKIRHLWAYPWEVEQPCELTAKVNTYIVRQQTWPQKTERRKMR